MGHVGGMKGEMGEGTVEQHAVVDGSHVIDPGVGSVCCAFYLPSVIFFYR